MKKYAIWLVLILCLCSSAYGQRGRYDFSVWGQGEFLADPAADKVPMWDTSAQVWVWTTDLPAMDTIIGANGQIIDFQNNNAIEFGDNSEVIGFDFTTANTIKLMSGSSGTNIIDFNDFKSWIVKDDFTVGFAPIASSSRMVWDSTADPNTLTIWKASVGVGTVPAAGYVLDVSSTSDVAIRGVSVDSYGIRGTSTNSFGVNGTSTNSVGIRGDSTYSQGVYGSSLIARAGYFTRNNIAGTATTAVVDIVQGSATSETNTVLRVQGDGTGDLVNIFDGATEVFTMLDGARVGFNETAPAGDAEWSNNDPNLILHDTDETDAADELKGAWHVHAERSGAEEYRAASIEVRKWGAADTGKAYILGAVNDGDDALSPTTVFTVDSNNFDMATSLYVNGTATSVLTGSIDPTASTSVTGVGTLFTTELVVGDRITVSAETRTVATITNATSLTVDIAFTDTANDTSPDKLAAIFRALDSSGNVDLTIQDNGLVKVGTGPIHVPDGTAGAPSYSFATAPTSGMFSPAAQLIGITAGGTERVRLTGTTFTLTTSLDFGVTADAPDTSIVRESAAVLNFGVDVASPAAYTLTGNDAVTSANVAGGDLTIAAGKSTGSAAGGILYFSTSPVGGAGTSQNAQTAGLSLNAANLVSAYADLAVEGNIYDKTSTDIVYSSYYAIIKTIGVSGSSTDFTFDSDADHTEQTEDLGAIIPAGAIVVAIVLECDETVTGSAVVNIDVGITTGTAELLAVSATDTDGDTNTTASGASPVLAHSTVARNVWVNADPAAVNWDQLPAGEWSLIIWIQDGGSVRTHKGL